MVDGVLPVGGEFGSEFAHHESECLWHAIGEAKLGFWLRAIGFSAVADGLAH